MTSMETMIVTVSLGKKMESTSVRITLSITHQAKILESDIVTIKKEHLICASTVAQAVR